MEFLHSESTLKPFIGMCGVNGKNERRMHLKDQGNFLKKSPTPTPTTISSFFGSVMLYSHNDFQQKQFEEDLALFIAKELVPLSFTETPFFWRLVLKQNPHLNFPCRRVLVNEILLKITKKMKEKYISLALESCNTCIVSFELWMSRAGVDVFVFIVQFLNGKWELTRSQVTG
jgi:hypothetical protein